MRYVTGSPWRGRVGHQLSCIWYAKLFSELFGFEYLHTPLCDRPEFRFSEAARWNGFFNLAARERLTADFEKQLGRITHYFGEYQPTLDLNLRYHALARLADAVPDQYLLAFQDLGQVSAPAILSWEQQGFARAGTLRRICSWFQDKLDTSPVYQAQAGYQHPDGMLKVAAYWRNFNPYELTSNVRVPAQRLVDAVAAVRALVYPRPISVVVCTQFLPENDPFVLDADHVDFLAGADPNPNAAVAFKTLIEADVAITTVGHSAQVVGIQRAFRRPTIGLQGWMIDGFAMPLRTEPFSLPEGFLDHG